MVASIARHLKTRRAWIGAAQNFYSAASLALLLFLGLPSAFFSTGAKNFPV
jgi:hypothetical protein